MTPATSEELRHELQVGFDQADAGQFVDWDLKWIKCEGRRRHRWTDAGQQIVPKLLGPDCEQ